MKTAVLLAVLAASIGVGCTGFKKNSKNGTFSYMNGLFEKQFSEGEYTEEIRNTNGVVKKVTLKLKGYQSDGAGIARAVAKRIAAGANPVKVP